MRCFGVPMKAALSALPPLLLLAGCRRPDIAAFGRQPLPIQVVFLAEGADPRSAPRREEYAAALRAGLAGCTMVVPAGVEPPVPAAVLSVVVTQVRNPAEPSPGAIGVAAGVAAGTLGVLAGDRDSFWNGFFWGIFAGGAVQEELDAGAWRLGYVPARVSAIVSLRDPRARSPLLKFSVHGREVVDAMQPLEPGDRWDPVRVGEEEARAFARVVVARLSRELHWLPLGEPSYYHPDPAPMEP